MKNKKKWMSLVLASAMAVTALAGCGSSADDKGSSDSGEAVFKICLLYTSPSPRD